ncbi:hypothetical protein [Streptomyces sp. NPDC089919]
MKPPRFPRLRRLAVLLSLGAAAVLLLLDPGGRPAGRRGAGGRPGAGG